MKQLYIASDHAGFELKEELINYLTLKGINVIDLGTNSTASVDFPYYAKKLTDSCLRDDADGILCCGTGIGMQMAANKQKGIRAAVIENTFSAKMCKEHNNCNVICLGSRVLQKKQAFEIVDTWYDAEFLEGKYARRMNQIEEG